MMIASILKIGIAVSGVLLLLCILLQSRGSGVGGAFGGEGNVYRTKRGIEKRLFQATIFFAIFFFGCSLASSLVS